MTSTKTAPGHAVRTTGLRTKVFAAVAVSLPLYVAGQLIFGWGPFLPS